MKPREVTVTLVLETDAPIESMRDPAFWYELVSARMPFVKVKHVDAGNVKPHDRMDP